MKKQLLHMAMLTIAAFIGLQRANAQWSTSGNNLAGTEKLGSTNSQSLKFYTNNLQRMKLDSLGRLGLGITTPVNLFTLKGAGSTPASSWVTSGSPLVMAFGETTPGNADFALNMASATANARGVMVFKRSRGTLAAPAAVANNDYLGSILAGGYDGSGFQGPATVDFYVDGTPSAGNLPARISLVTGTNAGNRAERLKVTSGGDVYVMTGNLGMASGQKTIQFGTPTNTSPAMMTMFPSGTQNATRMVIGHSSAYPNWGLQYNDSLDQWNFVASGVSGFNIDPYHGMATNANLFYTGSLSVKNDATVGGRLGVYGAIDSGYALNVNTDSGAIAGINVADPVDASAFYSSKSGINVGLTVQKTSTSTSTPCILANSTGSGGGIEAYGGNNPGLYAYSTNSDGVYGVTADSLSYAGYFSGDVYASGTYYGSDARLKKNIKPLQNGMDIINQLKPKSYDYIHDGKYGMLNLPRGNHFGLIAQDLEKVVPQMVKNTTVNTRQLDGKPSVEGEKGEDIQYKAVNYIELIPVLIKGMQEQQAEIESLKEQIKQLTGADAKATSATSPAIALSSAILEQNVPNPPMNNATSIAYNVPVKASEAYIVVNDLQGRKLQQINISQKGVGRLSFNTVGLAAGTYTYSLFVDGRIIETKQMVISGK